MDTKRSKRAASIVAALLVAGTLTAVTTPVTTAAAAPVATPAMPAVRLPQLTVDPAAAKRTAAGGTGVLRFPIRLLRPASTVVTVRYATSNDTAHAGTDYAAASGTATIPVGATTTTATVRITATSPLTADRAMRLTLTRPSGARLENDGAAGTVLADASTGPEINVGDAAGYRRIATSGQVVFPVLVSAATPSAVQVHCATASGTAMAYQDFRTLSTTVTVPAGATRATVTVVLPAKFDRTASNFTLNCSSPVGAALGRASATGSILPGAEPDLALAAQSTVVAGDPTGQTAQVPVYELGAAAGLTPVTFLWRYETPKSGGPYAVTIPAGSTSTTIPVPVYDGWCTGGRAPCGIWILAAGIGTPRHPYGIPVIRDRARVTIVPDPAQAAHMVNQPHDASVEVGDTFRTPVTLDVPTSGAQFTYTTIDGTAVAGRDYIAASGTFTADGGPGPTFEILPAARPLGALTFTVHVTPVAPATLAPWQNGDVTVRIDPIDTFRPTGTIHESSGKPLQAGLQVFFDTYPTDTQVPIDASGNFALAGFTPPAATGHVVVPPGWTGNQTFTIPTAVGPGHVDITVTAPA